MNLEEHMASTPPMQQHALIKGFQAGAASRDAEIAELMAALERKVASRDAEVAKLKDDNEYLYVAAIERDQLRAHINDLREALEVATNYSMLIKDAAIIQCALASIVEERKP